MFDNSVVDHNGSPSLPYVSLSLSFKSSKCVTSSSSISSSSNSKSSSSPGSTSLSPNSTFLEELDSSVYFLIVCPPFNEIVHHCHVLLCPSQTLYAFGRETVSLCHYYIISVAGIYVYLHIYISTNTLIYYKIKQQYYFIITVD